jgi:NAD(P)-dependent dehydrogenase (short-subunit alcohol dehydrogenase family)
MNVSAAGLRVLITAGARGIGRTFASTFSDAGAKVSVCDMDAAALAQFHAAYPEIGVTTTDVAVPDQVDAMFEALVSRLGGLDVLINNAGIAGPTAKIEDISVADWDRTITVDLSSMFYCTRRAVPLLKAAGGGSIINLSSIFGDGGSENRTAGYFAAKGGVNNLTRLLACEWGDRNVRVNALAPNFFISEMTRRLLEESGMADWMRSRTPMRRLGELEELVGPLLFLASDASSFITGTVIPVDGGYGAGAGYAQNPVPWDEWSELGRPITPDQGGNDDDHQGRPLGDSPTV